MISNLEDCVLASRLDAHLFSFTPVNPSFVVIFRREVQDSGSEKWKCVHGNSRTVQQVMNQYRDVCLLCGLELRTGAPVSSCDCAVTWRNDEPSVFDRHHKLVPNRMRNEAFLRVWKEKMAREVMET